MLIARVTRRGGFDDDVIMIPRGEADSRGRAEDRNGGAIASCGDMQRAGIVRDEEPALIEESSQFEERKLAGQNEDVRLIGDKG